MLSTRSQSLISSLTCHLSESIGVILASVFIFRLQESHHSVTGRIFFYAVANKNDVGRLIILVSDKNCDIVNDAHRWRAVIDDSQGDDIRRRFLKVENSRRKQTGAIENKRRRALTIENKCKGLPPVELVVGIKRNDATNETTRR